MNPGPWGILIIAVAALLLFGRGKIAGMMGEVASGIKAFRKGMSEEEKPVGELDQPRRDIESKPIEPTIVEAREIDRSKDA